MNREEIRQAIEVMQAFADGEKVEHRLRTPALVREESWEDNEDPEWWWNEFEYRKKPEPRTIWVNEYSTAKLHTIGWLGAGYESEKHAKVGASPDAQRVAVEYREVIDE